jgi:enediyne biosynthesis protein E4
MTRVGSIVVAMLFVICPRVRFVETQSEASLRAASGEPWFSDIARNAGVSFAWQSGHGSRYLMPEIMGGGGALFDMDGDGDLDLYLVQGGSLTTGKRPPNRLFRNRGDGTFDDVTAGSGAEGRDYGMGVAAGDVDNDGDADLYVTNVGANVLLRNDGRGRFTDITARARVDDPGWSTSAIFLDHDADGDLDLFVTHYLHWSAATELQCVNTLGQPDFCSPKSYHRPTGDSLFRNNGNGTFTNVTVQAGLRRAAGNGLGVVAGDFDRNGLPDLFVANDGTPNHLWLNQGGGRFMEAGLAWGCALDEDGTAKAGMGTDATDLDDDGDLDLLVVNLVSETDSFFRNQGRYFADDTAAVGLRVTSRQFTRFGTALIDFDNDGWLDVFEANGRVTRQTPAYSSDPYAEPSVLFRGTARGRFQEVAPRGGAASALVASSRAAIFGDLDNDGRIDIVVVNRDAPAFVLRNVTTTKGNWLGLRVLDEHGRDALGAEVRVGIGTRRVRRDVKAGYSYLASNDPRVHIGLGGERVGRNVRVRWPNGAEESFGDIVAGRYVTLRRGQGAPVRSATTAASR